VADNRHGVLSGRVIGKELKEGQTLEKTSDIGVDALTLKLKFKIGATGRSLKYYIESPFRTIPVLVSGSSGRPESKIDKDSARTYINL
jgi:hypothetical protein